MKVFDNLPNRNLREISKIGINLNYIQLETNYTDLKSYSVKKTNLNIKNFNFLPKINSSNNIESITNTEPNSYFSSFSNKINISKEKLKKLKIENLIEGLLKKSHRNEIRKYDFNSNTVGKIEEAKISQKNINNLKNNPKDLQKKVNKVSISSNKLYKCKVELEPKKILKVLKISQILSNSKEKIEVSLNKKFYDSIKPNILNYRKQDWDHKESKNLNSSEIQPKKIPIDIRNYKLKTPEKFNTIDENDLSSFHEQKRTSNNVSRVSSDYNVDNKELKTKYKIESYKSINLKSKYNKMTNDGMKKNLKPLNFDGGYLSSRMITDLKSDNLI